MSAVTFDAPGSRGHPWDSDDTHRLMYGRIVNYVRRPNLVNTAQTHVGEVRKVLESFNAADEFVNPSGAVHFDAAFDSLHQKDGRVAIAQLRDTWRTHNIDELIHFKDDGSLTLPRYRVIRSWPVATNVFRREPAKSRWISDSLQAITNKVRGLFGRSAIDVVISVEEWIWNQTSAVGADGQTTGAIGIHHTCESRQFEFSYAAERSLSIEQQ